MLIFFGEVSFRKKGRVFWGLATAMQREVAVVGKLYTGKDKDGDFKWMVKQKQYGDTLFLIAENFLDSLLDDAEPGGGTAVLRMKCPQRVAQGETPRAVGVPTGWSLASSGFGQLTCDIKQVIDLSLDRIALTLDQYPEFKRLMYSCDEKAPNLLGVKIFKDTLNPKVQEYISTQVQEIAKRVPSHSTLKKIERAEHRLLGHALLIDESNARREKKRPAEGTAMGDAKRVMRQPTLATHSKHPFGSL